MFENLSSRDKYYLIVLAACGLGLFFIIQLIRTKSR